MADFRGRTAVHPYIAACPYTPSLPHGREVGGEGEEHTPRPPCGRGAGGEEH